METVTHTIPPVFCRDARVLVLGTMPSPASREVGFYYGHPANRFWRVLSAVYGEEVGASPEAKAAFLRRHAIALWDVLASCTIRGASDATIRDPRPNDIAALLRGSEIRAVFTTGKKAHELYTRLCERACGIAAVCLPSPSPANCAVSFDALTEAYAAIRKAAGER